MKPERKALSRLPLSHSPVIFLLMLVLTAFSFGIHALILWLDPAITIWEDILIDTISVVAGATVFCLLLFSQRPFRVRLFEILERENIASAYRESEGRYRDLANSISDIFCAVNHDLCITYWNKATELRTGIPAQEALGKPAVEVLPILQNSAPLALFRQALKTQQPDRVIERYSFQSKSWVFEISAYPSASGLSVFVRDITEYAQAEQRLRESEAFANKILHSSVNGLYIYDIQAGQIIFINPQYTQLTGFTLADLGTLSGPAFLARFHPDDQARVTTHIAKVSRATNEEIFEIEYRFRTADERWIWCLSRETVFTRDEAGCVNQYIGTFVDITDQKMAVETLRSSQERFQTLFVDSPIPMWEEDFSGVQEYLEKLRSDGISDLAEYFDTHPEKAIECAQAARLVDANRAARPLSNPPGPESPLGQPNWSDIEEEFTAHKQSLLAIARGLTHFGTETVIYQQDGAPVHAKIDWSVVRGHESSYDRVLVSAVDITERIQAEQALRESETHFRSLFDHSPIALLEEDFSDAKLYLAKLQAEGVADLHQYFTQHPEQLTEVISCFKILDANQAAVDLSGTSTREQYIALLPSQLGIDPRRTLGEVLAIAEGRPVFHELQTGWNFQGKRMDVEVRWVAVPGHEHDLSRVIVSILDVTELKATESAWRESEAHFRSIFDSSPIPLIEQDFSGAKQYLDSLRGAGVVDFPLYFQEHPEALAEAISRYQILAANPATLEVYGVRSVPEYIDFIQAEFLADPLNLQGEVLAIAEGRSAFQGLERRCTVSGKTIYLIVRWVAVAGHEGDLSRAIISLMNVTELKETESALRASEGRYRALFEYSPISLWEEDFSGIRDYLNSLRASGVQDFGRFFAEHPDEVYKCIALTRVLNVNQATVELFRAADKSELFGALRETVVDNFLETQVRSLLAIADGKTQNVIEGRNWTLTGEPLDTIVRWSIPPGYEETYKLALVSIFDLTGFKRIEEYLRRRNAELTALNEIAALLTEPLDLRGALEGVLKKLIEVTHMQGGWVQLIDQENQTLHLEAHLGLSRRMEAEIATIPVGKYVSGMVARTGELAVFNEISVENWPGIQSITQDGVQSFLAVPIKASNQVLGVVGVFDRLPRTIEPEDLQVLTAAGSQLGMAIERARLAQEAADIEILQELNRLRSELIANVSHELRTPLGLIKISATALLSKQFQLDPETAQELLSGIDEEADRLEAIVSNLLDLSRLENLRLELNKAPVKVAELVHCSVETMRPRLSPEHRLVVNFPSDGLVLSLDAERIVQVLRNLIGNAIKYSPKGGTIEVRGELLEDELRVCVADQGIGIPAGDLERVFDRFYRVENEATRQVAGVGLGLSVCKGIVEAHAGRIWAESAPRSGCRFTFSLPLG